MVIFIVYFLHVYVEIMIEILLRCRFAEKESSFTAINFKSCLMYMSVTCHVDNITLMNNANEFYFSCLTCVYELICCDLSWFTFEKIWSVWRKCEKENKKIFQQNLIHSH